MLFWKYSAGGQQTVAVRQRCCGACCVYVLLSEGETAASMSNDGSLFDSGPLTHLRSPTCSDAHTTADKHVSVCVHGCVAQVLILLQYHPFWQPWNRWVKVCVCVRKGKERKGKERRGKERRTCLCVFSGLSCMFHVFLAVFGSQVTVKSTKSLFSCCCGASFVVFWKMPFPRQLRDIVNFLSVFSFWTSEGHRDLWNVSLYPPEKPGTENRHGEQSPWCCKLPQIRTLIADNTDVDAEITKR